MMTPFQRLAHMVEFTPVIRYDAKTGIFFFDHYQRTRQQVGAMLAHGLMSGTDSVQLYFVHHDISTRRSWSVVVKTSYVVQMLEFVGRHGWFWDEVEEHASRRESDHAFDPERITPGLYWGEVKSLLAAAEASDANAERHLGLGEGEAVLYLKQIAVGQRDAAEKLFQLSVPDYRQMRRRMRRHRRREQRRFMREPE